MLTNTICGRDRCVPSSCSKGLQALERLVALARMVSLPHGLVTRSSSHAFLLPPEAGGKPSGVSPSFLLFGIYLRFPFYIFTETKFMSFDGGTEVSVFVYDSRL